MKPAIWAIDLNWLGNLFYYANNNLERGVKFTLQRIREQFKPKKLLCAVDGEDLFRVKIYPEYKTNRPSKEEFDRRFKKLIEELDEKILQFDEYEADDILSSVARKCIEQNELCVLVSGDKDLKQCLRQGKVGQYLKKPRKSDWFFLSEKQAEKEWGISSEYFIDYQVLVGDNSDNILGAKGIGPERARKLINNFGNIDNILKNLNKLSKSQQKSLKDLDVDRQRKLIKLVNGLKVEI